MYCFIKQIKEQAYIFMNNNVINNNKPHEEFNHKTIVHVCSITQGLN